MLTADIFNNNNTIGNTKGNAKIDINVALPLSDDEMTETKVNTTEMPKIPNAEPIKNNPASLTGKPENTAINTRIIINKLQRKTKL